MDGILLMFDGRILIADQDNLRRNEMNRGYLPVKGSLTPIDFVNLFPYNVFIQ